LAISLEHGRLGGLLPGLHRDPFDRILAAQALLQDLPLVTNDPAFPAFGVKVLW
jgi:PIN domain nuclease of toxin-antitoxin system